MTPAEYGDLFTGGSGKVAKVPCSAMKPPHLLVPMEIAQSPKEVAKYADVLENCIRNGYAPQEFLGRCRDEGLKITAADAHIDLYKELVKLDKANKNGIWARIIKNNFAPLFVGRMDYVAGNPPWINLESLPSDYRRSVDPLWQMYGLKHSLGGPQIGSTKRDIFSLFVHSSSDHFLELEGRLGFLLTQSLIKSKGGGDGFRALSFRASGENVFLHPLVVHDLSDFSVFEGATNRTAVLICKKMHRGFNFPVRYVAWQPKKVSAIPEDWPLKRVFSETGRALLGAIPSDGARPSSPWLTVEPGCMPAIEKVRGRNTYRAYTGAYTGGLNGVYWLRRVRSQGGREVFENLWDVGKKHVAKVSSPLEDELVYPLIRGRDVHRWASKPSADILIPYDRARHSWIEESTLKREFPRAYSFLAKFREDLAGRRTALVRQQTQRGPFYAMVSVGQYTFVPWKVVYKRLSDEMQAAVIAGNKVPHEKLVLIPSRSRAEAHYIAAVLNSSPANLLLRGAAVRVQTMEYAPSDVSHLGIPNFVAEDVLHTKLVSLSGECHAAAGQDDARRVARLEAEIDEAAARLWGITDDELKAIQKALAGTRKSMPKAKGEEGD